MTLTLNAVIHFFPQDTLAYNAVLPNQVWLQMDQQFGRYTRKSYFDYKSPHCDLDTGDHEPIILPDTMPHDNTPSFQVWLKMTELFRRYRPDKIEHMDRMTGGHVRTDRRADRQSDSK